MKRTVLVTGGTRGVGRGIAEAFSAQGDAVVVCGRSEPDPAGSAVGEFLPADVRDPDQVASLIERVMARHGRLDVVVNNAGGSPPADAATASPRFSEAIIRLNLIAPLHVAVAANAVMQTQPEGGVILNISSLAGMRASPGVAAYGAAKAGLINLTESLAMAFAPRVRVNCVTPGAVETPELREQYGGEDYVRAVAASVPLGRLGSPADVASACVYLCSTEAAFVTGANLVVHGGGDAPPEAGTAGT